MLRNIPGFTMEDINEEDKELTRLTNQVEIPNPNRSPIRSPRFHATIFQAPPANLAPEEENQQFNQTLKG